jgi:hypothetical protein
VSRYEPLGRRRRAVVVAFCLLIAIDLLAVGSALLERNVVSVRTSLPPPSVSPGWSVAAPEQRRQHG